MSDLKLNHVVSVIEATATDSSATRAERVARLKAFQVRIDELLTQLYAEEAEEDEAILAGV